MARLIEGFLCSDAHFEHQAFWDHHHSGPHRGAQCVKHSDPGHQQHLHSWPARHGASVVTAARTCPIDTLFMDVARDAHPRRASLDLRSKPNSSVSAQPCSIKQRLRQRRYSIAMGELPALRPIKESRQEGLQDDAGGLDQCPSEACKAGRDAVQQRPSSSGTASGSGSSSGPLLFPPPSIMDHARSSVSGPGTQRPSSASAVPCIARHMRHSATNATDAGCVDQAGLLALLQLARQATQAEQYDHTLQPSTHQPLQQHRGQPHPPQVLSVHHADGHTLSGLNQEQIWDYLQQQRREQQEQQLWQAQQQRNHACSSLQQQQHQQEQHQSSPDCDADTWQAQEGWDALVRQQLQELSFPPPTRPEVSTTSRRNSAPGPRPSTQHRAMLRQYSTSRIQQMAAQHCEALLALQEIECELQQLLTMQERLATARAVAAPGSRAASACESAALQHQTVLWQAVSAREAIQAAVAEAAAAMSGCSGQTAGGAQQWDSHHGSLGHLDAASGQPFSCREGFSLPLQGSYDCQYPADAESLLQHFGHYAII